MDDLLLKEAVYTAIGRSPSDLENYIDFNQWLEGTLLAECAGTDSACARSRFHECARPGY